MPAPAGRGAFAMASAMWSSASRTGSNPWTAVTPGPSGGMIFASLRQLNSAKLRSLCTLCCRFTSET